MELPVVDQDFLRELVKVSRQKHHHVKWVDRDGTDRVTTVSQTEVVRLNATESVRPIFETGAAFGIRANINVSASSQMKKVLLALVTAGLLALGTVNASAQTAPKSVIHVVTVSWKEDAKPEQIKAALEGVTAMPAKFKGMTRTWVKAVKVQGTATHAIVMEFADEAALKAYSGSDAQKEWYKVYLPIRAKSTTFDITN